VLVVLVEQQVSQQGLEQMALIPSLVQLLQLAVVVVVVVKHPLME
jgi:hypothetical protein